MRLIVLLLLASCHSSEVIKTFDQCDKTYCFDHGGVDGYFKIDGVTYCECSDGFIERVVK
jgi:hypothetical protein